MTLSARLKYLVVSTLIAGFMPAASAMAQGIQVGELGQAQAFEPGSLNPGEGALGNDLWAGTQATTALNLIELQPDSYKNPVARSLVRSALLSPGVPPQNDVDGTFSAARMNGIIRLSEMSAAQDIAQRSPGLSSSPILKADLALLSGDVDGACQQSDAVIEGRTETYWMKLRAFCHVERGEGPAAQLTMDLIKNAGHKDIYFERILRHMTGIPGAPDLTDMSATPLHIAMMSKAGLSWPAGKKPAIAAAQSLFDVTANPQARLDALFTAAPALSDAQIREILEALAPANAMPDAGLVGGMNGMPAQPNLDTALSDKSAKGFQQLYTLAQTGTSAERSAALVEILKRAQTKGSLARFAEFLDSELSVVNYADVPTESVALIARAAVLRNDLGGLQQIYQRLEGNAQAQDRIALAADALGNGFYAGNLGSDIDGRLEAPGKRARAVRDALLAHGLGASLSDTALSVLSKKVNIGRMSGALFALESASQKRAQAETALRAALIIEAQSRSSDFEIYTVVDSLYKAGLTDQAAQIAALDFIADFPE